MELRRQVRSQMEFGNEGTRESLRTRLGNGSIQVDTPNIKIRIKRLISARYAVANKEHGDVNHVGILRYNLSVCQTQYWPRRYDVGNEKKCCVNGRIGGTEFWHEANSRSRSFSIQAFPRSQTQFGNAIVCATPLLYSDAGDRDGYPVLSVANGFDLNSSSPLVATTSTRERSVISPLRSARDSFVSSSRWMMRLRGRAP